MEMRSRRLGSSGLTVSLVGLGCRSFGGDRTLDRDGAHEVVHAALDAGITLFDTAASYGDGDSEEFLGAALRGCREDVVIATKFGGPRALKDHEAVGSRSYISRAVEGSLRRLQTDFIDLYQMHVPDPRTSIEETLSALDDLVAQGKVRYVGSSNFTASQIIDAQLVAEREHLTRFVSAQNRYNLLERELEREVVPACLKYGIGILPFYPLLHGVLTGRHPRGTPTSAISKRSTITDEIFDAVDALDEYARVRGIGLVEVAIVGLASRPALGAVIAGASRPDQVRANAFAAEWVPTADDLAALERILEAASGPSGGVQ
jgi:aryl-alcohol dehydrogenase-like predicted oxidoreductase